MIVAAFLVVLTVMEISVFYIDALKPVLVPVLLALAAAKFLLIAMFFMHLRHDSWELTSAFVFPIAMAAVLLVALILLFGYLSHHPAPVT